ncbi:p53-induced death domain-containing protein 1-like isoform X2 [Ptychodera flava]|uniref:p53-induced death domain-containing protein 1-like isoform X2 n=1 Tax=Ptychodera flava TaxID=63121 RepID=UPI003969F4D6
MDDKNIKKDRVVFLVLQHKENQGKLCVDCVQNTTVTEYLKELSYFGFDTRPEGRLPYSKECEILPGEKIFFNVNGDYLRPERRESGPFFIQKDNQKIIFVHPKNIEDSDVDIAKGSVTFFRYTGSEGEPLATNISEGPLFTSIDTISFQLKYLGNNQRPKSRKDSLQINLPQPVEGSADDSVPSAKFIPVETPDGTRDLLRRSLTKYEISDTIPLPANFKLELPKGFNDDVQISGVLMSNRDYSVVLDCYEVLIGDVIRLYPSEFNPSMPLILSHGFDDPTHEVVIKCSFDGTTDWVALDTIKVDNRHKAFISKFQFYAAVSRPMVDHFTINKSSKVCSSSFDPNIQMRVPERSTNDVRFMTMQVLTMDENMVERIANKYGVSLSTSPIISVTDNSNKSFLKPVTLTMPLAPRSTLVQSVDERSLVILTDNDDDEWRDITDSCKYTIHGDYVSLQVEHFSRYTNVRSKPKVSAKRALNKISNQMRNGMKLANLLLLQNKKDPCSLCIECVCSKIQDKRLQELQSHGFGAPKGKLPYGPDIEIREGDEIFFTIKGDHIESEDGNGRHFLMQFHSESKNHRMVQVKVKDATRGLDDELVGYVHFYTCHKPSRSRPKEKVPGRQFEDMRFTIPGPRRSSLKGPPKTRHKHRRSCSQRETEEVMKRTFMYLADNLRRDEWKQVGYTLGLDATNFSTLECNYPNDFWEQKYQMMLLWQQLDGKRATVERVIKSLKDRSLKKIAEGVKKISSDVTFSDSDSLSSGSIPDDFRGNDRNGLMSPTSPRPWTTGAGFCPSEYRKQSRVATPSKESEHVPPIQGTAKPLTPWEKNRLRGKSPAQNS